MELAVVGAGPAGCTAAIYAGRAGADTVVFDLALGGGLATWAPRVRNYPGLPDIQGAELMKRIQEQAKDYARFHYDETVTDLQDDDGAFQLITSRSAYTAAAVILCTGSLPRRLDIPGEKEFAGRGVSYGAVFDGPRVRGETVVVVGGGNAALSEAIYLRELGYDVSIIHRRNRLRAEDALEQEARDKGISIIWESVVEEIVGSQRVESVTLKNVATGEIEKHSVDGVFISIGTVPRSELARAAGITTDEAGYIETDVWQRTNRENIFAAGDVTRGPGQILTTCAEGATAALAALEVLGRAYHY